MRSSRPAPMARPSSARPHSRIGRPAGGGRRSAALLAGTAVVLSTLTGVLSVSAQRSVAATPPLLPSVDPFYTYHGPLASIAPGTVLKSRPVPAASNPQLEVTQVLYRTTGELGHPTVTVATVVRAVSGPTPTQILSYQEAYDGLGPKCEPSYKLQSGLGSLGQVTGYLAAGLLTGYLSSGLVLVVPDYEGVHQQWTAGQEAGYETLDAARAAENLLKLAPATTRVGLVGYSGGAIATDYATELAPRYAPGLDLAGAAEGGVPVDFAHVLRYVNGSPYWSGVIPMALVGLGRAFQLPLDKYLSTYGESLTSAIAQDCLGDVAGHYPGLTYQRLFKPRYRDIFAVPAFRRIFAKMVMGRAGTPHTPVFIGEGVSDGTGDGVMVAKDVEDLAHEYCRRGATVELRLYKGLDHNQAVAPFVADALSFLAKALRGEPVPNGCGAIGTGGSPGPPL